jgi:hypothetical protein
MLGDFLPIPDAEYLPFAYACMALKLVVCVGRTDGAKEAEKKGGLRGKEKGAAPGPAHLDALERRHRLPLREPPEHHQPRPGPVAAAAGQRRHLRAGPPPETTASTAAQCTHGCTIHSKDRENKRENMREKMEEKL